MVLYQPKKDGHSLSSSPDPKLHILELGCIERRIQYKRPRDPALED